MAERPASAPRAAADAGALLERARALCYLDPPAAAAAGRALAADDGPLAAEGWLHVALAEVRQGSAEVAAEALAAARRRFEVRGDITGLAWCDEVQAIALRRAGDYAASAALQAAVDERDGIDRDALYRFVAHNSRAIGQKFVGDPDVVLRHFYQALAAAEETGLAGPRITALANLGGYHQDLFNLDDARQFTEQALAAALEHGVRSVVSIATANLVFVRHTLGDLPGAAAAAAGFTQRPEAHLPGAASTFAVSMALGRLAVGDTAGALAHLEGGARGAVADGDGLADWTWIGARALLERGDAAAARSRVERTLARRAEQAVRDQPHAVVQMLLAHAQACRMLGDHATAFQSLAEAHERYVALVGRSARARRVALAVGHQLDTARRERDHAVQAHRAAEDDRRRLAELNAALEAKMTETEQLHQQLREQALRDALTGLHNRRYLFEAATGVLELARRQQRIVCVALLDLDHFKLLNDTHGHHVGDLVLQRFATLLRSTLRRSDVLCRYGGEEFVAVMPDLDVVEAEAVLGRLQAALNAEPEPQGRRRLPGASFSAGIALFPHHGVSLERLLKRADKAMYRAKERGRSRVEQPPETGFGSLA